MAPFIKKFRSQVQVIAIPTFRLLFSGLDFCQIQIFVLLNWAMWNMQLYLLWGFQYETNMKPTYFKWFVHQNILALVS